MKKPYIDRIQYLILLGVIIAFYSCNMEKSSGTAAKESDSLKKRFKDPPMQARPRAYWAWDERQRKPDQIDL